MRALQRSSGIRHFGARDRENRALGGHLGRGACFATVMTCAIQLLDKVFRRQLWPSVCLTTCIPAPIVACYGPRFVSTSRFVVSLGEQESKALMTQEDGRLSRRTDTSGCKLVHFVYRNTIVFRASLFKQ